VKTAKSTVVLVLLVASIAMCQQRAPVSDAALAVRTIDD
jgi:hypothetical protein